MRMAVALPHASPDVSRWCINGWVSCEFAARCSRSVPCPCRRGGQAVQRNRDSPIVRTPDASSSRDAVARLRDQHDLLRHDRRDAVRSARTSVPIPPLVAHQARPMSCMCVSGWGKPDLHRVRWADQRRCFAMMRQAAGITLRNTKNKLFLVLAATVGAGLILSAVRILVIHLCVPGLPSALCDFAQGALFYSAILRLLPARGC